MLRCQTCGTENRTGSQYCDNCGSRQASTSGKNIAISDLQPQVSGSGIRPSNITSVEIPSLVQSGALDKESADQNGSPAKKSHARLIIERGTSAETEFSLSAEESYIGRWDADNGIFPDVDLDAHDPDAKVSRRHARILFRNNFYMIEDLGSTNGTFVNRGKRLLPGTPVVLKDSDEIIVGKSFLRFQIVK